MHTNLPTPTQTIPNTPRALFQARLNARREQARLSRRAGQGDGDRRTITMVRDLSLPAEEQLRLTSAVLDPLPVAGVAELRRATWKANAAGKPRFLCACCNQPVRLAQSPAGPGVPRDGRGAHFAHVPRKGAPPCSWRSKPGLRSIGAIQYAGQQEGALHLARKLQLAECLRRDSRFSDVRVERQIRIGDGRRQPDVSAVLEGRTIAFDIQLAVLPLSEILAREEFYAAHNIHHVVLTDAGDTDRLARLAFSDLHLQVGGRIFAMDDAVVAASMASGQLQLIELSLLPRFRGFLPLDSVWEARQVDLAVIMLAPLQRKLAGEARYRETLRAQARDRLGHLRQRMRDAGAQCRSLAAVRSAYAEIAPQVQAPSFSRAEEDGLGLVFGWLGQLETCHRDTSIHRAAAVDELEVRTLALLNHARASCWISLLELAAELLPTAQAAQTPAVVDRLGRLRRTSRSASLHLMHHHRDVLVLHYPWLGFRLLARPPVRRRHLH